MPKYIYKCKECEVYLEATHSMSERLTYCDNCDTIDSLMKVPSNIAVKYRDSQVGKVVDDYIEEAKESLREEKQRASKEEYKND